MSILHTVNKSPFEHKTLELCLQIINSHHSLLLIEDGVYAALIDNPYSEQLEQLQTQGLSIYALRDDLNSRGLDINLIKGIAAISMDDFVALCSNHTKTQSWY